MKEPTHYAAWDRVKVGKSFFDLLIQHPVFQTEPKAINTAQYWLAAIDAAMDRNDGEPVTWDWKDIDNRFGRYSQSHTKFRDALKDLGLIEFSASYTPPTAFTQGECRSFAVTSKGRDLVSDGNREWLYQLLDDPVIRRRNQIAISKRGVRHKVFAEREKQIIHNFNATVDFDWDGVRKQLEQDKVQCPSRYRSALYHLLAFKRRAFPDLEIKNGRLYHEFVALPSEYRVFAVFEGKPYLATVDVRACWPTFLGKLLWEFFKEWPQATNNDRNAGPDDLRTAVKLREEVNHAALEKECGRWTELFTDPRVDPREAIMKEAGVNIGKGDMKKCLNTWLNGARKYQRESDGRWNLKDNRALEAWFGRSFPELTKVWATFPRKLTGTWISENYEGRLMLDPSLYALANAMGMTLSYEYDGVGVFASREDAELPTKLENVQVFIQHQSFDKFKLPVAVKVEMLA